MCEAAGSVAFARVRASDPKVDAGFGKNPMRKQRARAAAPIPPVCPPLYVETQLAPTLSKGDVVILDSEAAKQMIQ